MPLHLKNRSVVVDGHHPVHGGAALIVWLLGQGASVTVAGVRDDDASASLRRRVDEQLKRMAPDGRAYSATLARLAWTARRSRGAVDALQVFAGSWPRRMIGVAGAHGKTTTALWAGHLIGDAVVAGHTPERPYVAALGSRAKTAVLEVHGTSVPPEECGIVLTTDDATKYRAEHAFLQRMNQEEFVARWGSHNLDNLATAAHAARLVGVPAASVVLRIASLPQVPFRQEIVYRDAKLTVINDTMATTPTAGIAALARWGGPTTILVAGGAGDTDDYRVWAREVTGSVRRTNVVFLSGSATQAMRRALRQDAYGMRAFGTLEGAWHAALERAATYVSATILFSPATDAPDLFEDVLERGRQFNALARVLRPGRGA